MPNYSVRWVSLYNELSHAKKSLSAQKRNADILVQSNCRLVKDNTAWEQSNCRLVKDNTAWVKSYNNLAACHSELLTFYNSLLERSQAEDCEGTSAEDYLTSTI